MKRMGRGGPGMMSIGKSKAKEITGEMTGVTFADVGGADQVEVELKEIIQFLKDPSRFTSIGAKLPTGVLLAGPPGTGKTLLAKATAGEAGVPFFSMSGSEFVEMFVGVGASRVRDLFNQAKEKAPCITFIDEIDAIGQSRSSAGAVRYACPVGAGYLPGQIATRNLSPKTEALIDSEVRKIIDTASAKATELLTKHEKALHGIAERLQEAEVIDGVEIERIVKTMESGV